jgi:hypothetical protein
MYTIATLYALRQRLGLATTDTADDPRLLDALQSASLQVERLSNRRFCPRRATLEQNVNIFQASELLLDDDLLELTTLVNGDGSTIDPANIVTIPGNDGPISVIRLTGGEAFTWENTPIRAVSVTGVWGWHDRWSEAWRDSGDTVQDDPLGDGATSLTVTDADGADSEQVSPRFQVGQLLRIEDEYLRVLAVDTSTNIVTVQRGANGTTAAAHVQSTAIDVYRPVADIESLVVRWAAWLYKDADTRTFSAVPGNLTKALDPVRRVGVKS